MKIIVPMAGRGSRLRPHTLTVPKPLVPVAGKPIVHRLVSDIAKVLGEPIEEVAFILGDPAFFGDEVVESLKSLAEGLGAKASIYRQDEPLGTGHAIMSAKPSLSGLQPVSVAEVPGVYAMSVGCLIALGSLMALCSLLHLGPAAKMRLTLKGASTVTRSQVF